MDANSPSNNVNDGNGGKPLNNDEIDKLLNGEVPVDPYVASLQRELEQAKLDKLAMQQEIISGTLTAENDDTVAGKQLFKKQVPSAITEIFILAESAESESVRLNACKYIIGCGLGNALSGMTSSDDSFKNLLTKIKVKEKDVN